MIASGVMVQNALMLGALVVFGFGGASEADVTLAKVFFTFISDSFVSDAAALSFRFFAGVPVVMYASFKPVQGIQSELELGIESKCGAWTSI